MDKKNYLAPKAQNSSSCDASNKQQWPKQQRRRENAKQEPLRNNSNNNSTGKSRYENKKPRARQGGPENTNASRNGSRLNEESFEAELNSVFVTGSKKQNLNHLLNFHFYNPRETAASAGGTFAKTGYHRSGFVKKYRYNKEQYLQANCQFVVQPGDYRAYTNSPDLLVDWEKIEQIKVSSCEEAQCPICLYPPNSAKMTRCGHVYCWGCLLHYLALSDKTWRKCPICYESIHLKDLKSTVSKHLQALKVGDMIDLELMRREKGSLFVSKASGEINSSLNNFPSYGDPSDNLMHSKLIIANPAEILSILDQERNELEFQMIENGEDCPESIFVQQAMDLLQIKREEILKLVGVEETHHPIQLNACANEFVPKTCESPDEAAGEEMNGDLIDEDSCLTLDDIEIVPKSHSKNYYYYQSSDGQNIFLHALNSRMLQLQYGCLETAPHKIRGRIVQMESCSLNEDLRKRLKYLQHLPVSSQFNVVEIEFDSETISGEVMESFRDELLHRKKLRQRRDRDERKREKHINEINDRQMGKIISQTANIDIESTSHFPACGNFETFGDMPLLGSSLSSGASERSNSPTLQASASAGPSFARMLTHKTTKKQQAWPTLASGDSSAASTSFFGAQYPKRVVQVTGNQNMLPSENGQSDDEDSCKDEAQVPIYKNSLGDALANALSSAEPRVKGGKKSKKAKKTLLFSTGMFNG